MRNSSDSHIIRFHVPCVSVWGCLPENRAKMAKNRMNGKIYRHRHTYCMFSTWASGCPCGTCDCYYYTCKPGSTIAAHSTPSFWSCRTNHSGTINFVITISRAGIRTLTHTPNAQTYPSWIFHTPRHTREAAYEYIAAHSPAQYFIIIDHSYAEKPRVSEMELFRPVQTRTHSPRPADGLIYARNACMNVDGKPDRRSSGGSVLPFIRFPRSARAMCRWIEQESNERIRLCTSSMLIVRWKFVIRVCLCNTGVRAIRISHICIVRSGNCLLVARPVRQCIK